MHVILDNIIHLETTHILQAFGLWYPYTQNLTTPPNYFPLWSHIVHSLDRRWHGKSSGFKYLLEFFQRVQLELVWNPDWLLRPIFQWFLETMFAWRYLARPPKYYRCCLIGVSLIVDIHELYENVWMNNLSCIICLESEPEFQYWYEKCKISFQRRHIETSSRRCNLIIR